MSEPKFPYMPMLSTRGSHYDIGYNVGITFGDKIKRYWNESVDVNNILKPYNKTEEGQKYFKSCLDVCTKNFPQYVREIRGIADGSGMPFEDIFLLNTSKEVHNVLSQESKWTKSIEQSGCSDIFLNTPGCKILAHNEDCDPKIKPYGYLLHARIVENGVETESFTSYCYPGVLPGCAFSFNRHGMVFTIDGLYANFVVHGAPNRMFLNRSIIKSRNIDEVVELAKNKGFGSAYGFTVNIVDVKTLHTMWSVEVGPQSNESLVHIHTIPEQADPQQICHYLHFNNFKHLTTSEIPNIRSSSSRTQTAEKYPAPKTRRDVMTILGDTSNSDYPIYRTDRPTDPSDTIFTAVSDVIANKVQFFQDNPSGADIHPVLSLPIKED